MQFSSDVGHAENIQQYNINSVRIDLPSISDIQNAQLSDTKLSVIISKLRNNPIRKNNEYFLKNDLLMHTAFIPRLGGSKRVQQIVIPDKYKPHILAANHLVHFGHLKTYNAIREKYFWEGLYTDTKHYVLSCKQCISFKSPKVFAPVPLQRNYIPSKPMEFVSCDFIGKLPTTAGGNSYILTFIDTFTKFIKLYAVPNQTAKVAAEALLQYSCVFGFPCHLYSDKGPSFMSEVFRYLCKRLGVTKLNTSPRHPSSNGSAERINLNIKKSISIFAQQDAQWDLYLNYYELFYNNTVHSTTQEKLAYLQFSYDPILPTDILQEKPPSTPIDYRDFVTHKTVQFQRIFKQVRENLVSAAENQEERQHQIAKIRDFRVGDLVYLYSPETDRDVRLPKKRAFLGPMRVLKIHSKVLCTVISISDPRAKPTKVNTVRLIPYTERRQDLDYFSHILKENTAHTHSPSSPSIFEKPYAQFDEVEDCFDLLTYSFHSTTNGIQKDNTSIQTVECPSPAPSSTTIIYDPVSESPRVPMPVRDPYLLRSRENKQESVSTVETQRNETFAERFLNWSLTMTEDNDSPSEAIGFLKKLSEKLD